MKKKQVLVSFKSKINCTKKVKFRTSWREVCDTSMRRRAWAADLREGTFKLPFANNAKYWKGIKFIFPFLKFGATGVYQNQERDESNAFIVAAKAPTFEIIITNWFSSRDIAHFPEIQAISPLKLWFASRSLEVEVKDFWIFLSSVESYFRTTKTVLWRRLSDHFKSFPSIRLQAVGVQRIHL